MDYGRSIGGLIQAEVKTLTKPFGQKLIQDRKGDVLIITLDADGIQRWIDAPDRLAHLNDLHQQATLGA